MSNKKTVMWSVATLLVLGTVSFALWKHHFSDPKVDALYRSFASPDGRYRVDVYGSKGSGLFPGQGGDVPGVVVLRNSDGRELQRKSVEMVQLVTGPRWESGRVVENLIFDWELPPPGK